MASKVTGQRMRYPQPPRLNDPANIGSCCEGQANVMDAGPGPGHLENYMRLPVEQYAVLDGANISRLGPNLFKLVVPRLEFFDVWIEPELEVRWGPNNKLGHVLPGSCSHGACVLWLMRVHLTVLGSTTHDEVICMAMAMMSLRELTQRCTNASPPPRPAR